MKQKICCRCLTEPETGYGNFNRCLTLANQLKPQNISTTFIVDKNQKISDELKKKKFDYVVLPNSSKNNQDVFISKFMTKNNFSIVLLDMRQFGQSLSRNLKKTGKKIIMIDDIWSNTIYSDIFFNSTNVKTRSDYNIINKSSKIFLGTKYWIINENFRKYRKRHLKIIKDNKLNLVISMGGSDPNNLTYSLLKNIKERNDLNIKVIVGPINKNFSKITSLVQNSKHISLLKSPNNIFQIFSNADLVISNGGNTLFELIALRVSTIVIPAFTHETYYTKKFSKNNCILGLRLKEKNYGKICSVIDQFKTNKKLQKQLYESTKGIVDGDGLKRTVNIIGKFTRLYV